MQCLDNAQARVTNTMNTKLQKQYTNEEVYETLKQMQPLKSPGPDDISACFF